MQRKSIRIILLTGIATAGLISTSYADTCKQENEGKQFHQVVLGDGGGRCDYGEAFNFNHSYEFSGNYKPATGPWQGSSSPGVVYCRTKYSASCVFELSKKKK